MGVNLASLSSTQSGEPDAGCQLSRRVDHGGTHRSTLDVAGPGGPVAVGSWSSGYRSPPGFAWSNTEPGEPHAGCQLPPRVDYGGTHRSTLGPASPGVAVGVGDTFLWGNTSGEPCPTRPSRVPLRCDPDRRSSRTAPSRFSVPPYIPSAQGGTLLS